MKSSICTLIDFDGDYHFGLASLVNTLYFNGFRGDIWAAYRGTGGLPPWVTNPKNTKGYVEFEPVPNCRICFLPVGSSGAVAHDRPQLTIDIPGFDPLWDIMFYKPQLMLELFARNPEIDKLYYFDCDVIALARWSFFEMWVSCGLALCEDINSPLHHTHPIRRYWQQMYEPFGFHFQNTTDIYVNSGFVGISRQHQGFLETWQRIEDIMKPRIPDLPAAHNSSRAFPFWRWEQDALNIALSCEDTPVSLLGKEGMDFAGPGFGYCMSHWSGQPKPWNCSYTARAMQGLAPRPRDRQFLHHTRYPVNVYSRWRRWLKHLDLTCANAISVFRARRFDLTPN